MDKKTTESKEESADVSAKDAVSDISTVAEDLDMTDESAETADAEDDSETNVNTKKSGSGAGWLLLLLILIGAAVYLFYPQWFGEKPQPFVDQITGLFSSEDITPPAVTPIATIPPLALSDDTATELQPDQMAERLALLEKRIELLEQRDSDPFSPNQQMHGPAIPLPDLAALQERLTELEATLHQKNTEQQPLAEDIATLKTAVSALSTQKNSGKDVRGIRLLLAFDRLESAVEAGIPYKQDLTELGVLLEASPEATPFLKALAPYAERGAPSHEELTGDVIAMARTLANAEQQKDDSLSGRLRNGLSSVITIRKVGAAVEGDDMPARLARIEALARDGALSDALREVRGLPLPPSSEGREVILWQQKTEFALSLPELMRGLRQAVHHAVFRSQESNVPGHDS